jgi:hypothetical protein
MARNETAIITTGTSYEGIDMEYAGKPLACSSPLREIVNGRETRVHDGFGAAIKPSTFIENWPRPQSTWSTDRKR